MSLSAGELRAFRPKGVRIFRIEGKHFDLIRHDYVCKARGRTGASIRSRLQRLPDDARQRVLADWERGHAALLR